MAAKLAKIRWVKKIYVIFLRIILNLGKHYVITGFSSC